MSHPSDTYIHTYRQTYIPNYSGTCVPDLSLNGLSVDLDASGGKLHADGGLGLQVELVACEP